MKKFQLSLLMFVIAAASVFVFTTCQDKEGVSLAISVLPTELDFTANDNSEKTVYVETKSKKWEVATTFDWINVVREDDRFTVTVDKYTDASALREGTIVVKAPGKEITVTVRQAAAVVNTLSLNPTSLTFEAENTDTKNVVVITNAANWSFSVAPAASWLTLEKNGNTLYVTPTGLNLGSVTRTATVTVTAENATTQLQINQEITQISYTSFDTAEGFCFGNLGGVAGFVLDMFNASDDMVGINITGFTTYTSAKNFKLKAGTYYLPKFGEENSYFVGEYDSDEDELFGTFAYDFNLKKIILITGGTFEVALSGNIYTITTNFTGEDALTNASVNNIRYTYTGTIEFEDLSEDMFDTGIVESEYTATGTPQLTFGSGEDASEWEGLVIPIEDDFGQYIAITNFADEDITIYADYIGGKFILDTQYPIWDNEDYVAFLEPLFYFDDNLYGVPPDLWDMSIQYDPASQTIDFSHSYEFPDIGVQNFSVCVYAYKKSNGEEAGFLTNIYPNIKLVLSPVSPPPAKAAKLSSKTVFDKKALTRSKKHIPSLQGVEKNVITIDKSQLVPVDGKKFDRIKMNGGKPVDRRSVQKTPKK